MLVLSVYMVSIWPHESHKEDIVLQQHKLMNGKIGSTTQEIGCDTNPVAQRAAVLRVCYNVLHTPYVFLWHTGFFKFESFQRTFMI